MNVLKQSYQTNQLNNVTNHLLSVYPSSKQNCQHDIDRVVYVFSLLAAITNQSLLSVSSVVNIFSASNDFIRVSIVSVVSRAASNVFMFYDCIRVF